MSRFKVLLITIFIVGGFLRIWNLSADPSILLDSGQVGDEGYWLYNARNLALFGNVAQDDYYHDFAAAPFFSFVSYLSFLVFGVGFWQGRIVSATAGIVILVFTYFIARGINRSVALLSTFLVAINTLLLLHNRLAVGESLSIMFATIGFYLLLKKTGAVMPGFAFAFSLLAKTTSFLYLPSACLIIMSDLSNRRHTLGRFIRFSVTFSSLFLFIFGFLYLNWGRQISLIYSTFGTWYVPRNLAELWQNVFNFVIHPFWGSPFLFTLVILAILNSLNYLFDRKRRTYERKFLILWILGIIIFGPLISILSNARLLGLVVPIAILASQEITNPDIRRFDFSRFKLNLISKKPILLFFTVIASIPVAAITAKIVLALIKRGTGDAMVVYNLPYFAIVFLVLISVAVIKWRGLLTGLVKFDCLIMLFLPIASFIPLFWGYLNFFALAPAPRTTIISVIIAIVFVCFFFLVRVASFQKRFVFFLLLIYIIFNIFGILTIFYKPSYKIKASSDKLGEIADSQSLIGFYGQELAIGNRSRPIYWAPNLNYAGGLNSNWRKYDPKFLLVTQYFDSKPENPEAWPNEKTIGKGVHEITSLDLTRTFLKAERVFKITVYEIND